MVNGIGRILKEMLEEAQQPHTEDQYKAGERFILGAEQSRTSRTPIDAHANPGRRTRRGPVQYVVGDEAGPTPAVVV